MIIRMTVEDNDFTELLEDDEIWRGGKIDV